MNDPGGPQTRYCPRVRTEKIPPFTPKKATDAMQIQMNRSRRTLVWSTIMAANDMTRIRKNRFHSIQASGVPEFSVVAVV